MHSTNTTFVTGLVKTFTLILTLTFLTKPSLPTMVSTIFLEAKQNEGFARQQARGHSHTNSVLQRICKFGMYSFNQRFQKTEANHCIRTCLQRRL